jgi:hypothetical protein
MLQLSDINYDTTLYDTTPECFIVNFEVLADEVLPKKVAFQKHIAFPALGKKVSFNPFKDIIYIPTYNKEYIPHLWWSMSELTYIHEQVKQEIFIIINNSLINIDVKCALGILCAYNE